MCVCVMVLSLMICHLIQVWLVHEQEERLMMMIQTQAEEVFLRGEQMHEK